jgi:hypothetical protein
MLRSDQQGRFTATELPQGDYLILATADADASMWLTEEYLETLRPQARHVALKARDRQTLTLPCSGAP